MCLLATAFRHATNSARKLALADTKKNIAMENQPTLPESDRDTATDTTNTADTGGIGVFILLGFKLRHAAGCDEGVTSEDCTRKTTLVVQFDVASSQIKD